MKTILLLTSLLTGVISAFTLYPATENPEKERAIVSTTINALSGLHYEPVELNDQFSERVYRVYLDRLDGSRRFFTQDDINAFEAHERQIDNQLEASDLSFFDLVEDRFALAIERSQGIYREILAEPFDYEVAEEVELDGEKKSFPANDAELRESWRKVLKWETMTRLNDKIERQQEEAKKAEDGTEDEEEASDAKDDDEDQGVTGKTVEQLEADARRAALKSFDSWYERMAKLKRSDRLSDYLNAITSVYDPHTGYFAPIDKDNFDINMSGKLEGIGARLQTDGDYTKVSDIVAGGPAWRGKQLAEKDVIMAVAQENEVKVDISGMNINEVVQLIRGKKDTKVILTVKKVDGTIEDIEIVRDVVILEEGFAKSLLLDTEEGKQVGYLRLPRFYADFSDEKGRSSFRDVRTEVEKLKTEGVEGIILDLRSNGGGSLRDVVDMTGLFFEEGPVVQVKSRGRSPEVLEDDDSRVQYDGPLVVMVNEFSASASEILAAALQDYGRAIIVGNKTFGKGTVQRFIDLDVAIRGASNVKPLGNLKLTTQKFYRVNGGSTQLEGVTPDIILPDSYAYLETGERENDFPMPFDKIAPADYDRVPAFTAMLNEVRELSNDRVERNEVFQAIDTYAKDLRTERDETIVSLKLKDYMAEQTVRSAESKAYKELFKPIEKLKVDNLKLDKLQMENADEDKIGRNTDFIERVQKDLHLYETLLIVNDMIDAEGQVAERGTPKE